MMSQEFDEKEIQEHLRKEPILKFWNDNFQNNLNNGNLFNSRAKPIGWLKNNPVYRGVTCLLVGAGQSLDDKLDLVKENRDKFFIIVADAALPALLEKDIIPNIVAVVDPSEKVNEYFEHIPLEASADIYLVAPTTVHPDVLKNWKGKYFMYSQSDRHSKYREHLLKKLNLLASFDTISNAGFVGYTMIEIACLFEPKKIVFIGYDFSFGRNRLYCEGTLRSKFKDRWLEENDLRYKSLEETEGLIEVNRSETKTTSLFNLYFEMFRWRVTKAITLFQNCSVDLYTELLPYKEFKEICDGITDTIKKQDIWIFVARKKHRR